MHTQTMLRRTGDKQTRFYTT